MERLVPEDAGVVDEDVDLAERVERSLDDGFGRRRIGGVALDRERAGQSLLLRADDFREGSAAFAERRAPNFTDR